MPGPRISISWVGILVSAVLWSLVGAVTVALAQLSGSGSQGISQAYVDNAIANLQSTLTSAMPTPLAGVPPGPNGAGVSGSGNSYVPGNAAQKQTVQRTTVLTNSSGVWSVTWNNSFVSSTPVINPQPVNSTPTNPITCNVTSRSATAVSGQCWTGATNNNALLSLVIALAPTSSAANTPVMVFGAEPTQ